MRKLKSWTLSLKIYNRIANIKSTDTKMPWLSDEKIKKIKLDSTSISYINKKINRLLIYRTKKVCRNKNNKAYRLEYANDRFNYLIDQNLKDQNLSEKDALFLLISFLFSRSDRISLGDVMFLKFMWDLYLFLQKG